MSYTYYKGFYGAREQYIADLIMQVRFWARSFAEGGAHNALWCEQLDKCERYLADEGYDWDEIEAIEIAAMQDV